MGTVDIPMEPKIFGLLISTLFFLVSLLINLLQRRYGKTRLGRMLRKEEAIVNYLGLIDKNLGKLEVTCTLEMQGSSPQEIGKTIHLVRNEVRSIIGNVEEHLQSFAQYRRKQKARQKKGKSSENRVKNRTQNPLGLQSGSRPTGTFDTLSKPKASL